MWGHARTDGLQISIRQNFALNGEDHYTVFDVPISVTNSIPKSDDRPSCDVLVNKLLSPEDIDAEGANSEVEVLFAPDDATEVEYQEEGRSVRAMADVGLVLSGALFAAAAAVI